uniref:Uncharacterized protein n=1 Tax=Cyprinus carpio TaxID=7962 RepID=A0A8C2H7V4_CYPCA
MQTLSSPYSKTIPCSNTHKDYDQARGRTRVNIRPSFQRWRELKEREGLELDAEFALFLLDR